MSERDTEAMAYAHDLEFVFDRPLSAHAQALVMNAIEHYLAARNWSLGSTFTFTESESSERLTVTVETPDMGTIHHTALRGSENHYRTLTPLAEWYDHDLGAFQWQRAYTNAVSEVPA